MEIKPYPGECLALKGHPQRLPANYHRTQGTEQFLGFLDVHGNVLNGLVCKRKTSQGVLSAIQHLRTCYPKEQHIYLILDNLSSHRHKNIQDFTSANRIHLTWTPTYASWLNRIESHFTPLKKFTLSNSNDPDHRTRRKRIYRYLTWRNSKQGNSKCPLKFYSRI
jgi:transposase